MTHDFLGEAIAGVLIQDFQATRFVPGPSFTGQGARPRGRYTDAVVKLSDVVYGASLRCRLSNNSR